MQQFSESVMLPTIQWKLELEKKYLQQNNVLYSLTTTWRVLTSIIIIKPALLYVRKPNDFFILFILFNQRTHELGQVYSLLLLET